jgi:hypothetical protein
MENEIFSDFFQKLRHITVNDLVGGIYGAETGHTQGTFSSRERGTDILADCR